MQTPYAPPPWSTPGWDEMTAAWIEERLAERGLSITGPMEPRARPWSIVQRVPTSGGPVHFKATAPGMARDATLTSFLAPLAGRLLVAPLAVDPARGWMLLPHAGERLRDAATGEHWIRQWRDLLPRYAELQLRCERRDTRLLDAGALDRRLGTVPRLLARLLDEPEWLLVGEQDGLSEDELTEVRGILPPLREACRWLDAAGIGPSIQHDDLHDGNVVVQDGSTQIIDWGDACAAHPFGTLLVTLNSIADHLGVPVEGREVGALRDAYLEPWTIRLPGATLRALVPIARWTAMVGRALTWRAALPHATLAERREWGSAVPAWLRELREGAPARLP